MLETGDGLAMFGGFITLSTAMFKFIPRKSSGNGKSMPDGVTDKTCGERRADSEKYLALKFDNLEKEITNTGTRLQAVEGNTNEILKYVKMK